ncbi:MAG: ATP-binding protein [Eubacteriales bacterium]
MKELSLNILDIAQNSITAGATLIEISICETEEQMVISIADNGCGMSKELLAAVSDPFCTTRKTRKVGLGIPFFRLAAEQTGGHLEITSSTAEDDPEHHGTLTKAFFFKNHIDFTPLGDIVSTLCTLFQSCKDFDIVFIHTLPDGRTVQADTRLFKKELDGVPLDNPDVLVWIRDFLSEQYHS